MQITIHRGSCEIGGSCIELQSGSSRIVLELGMPLVEPDGTRFDMDRWARLQGPELVECGVLPNVRGLYRWHKDSPSVDGLFLSHAHMDHCGFSHFVHPRIKVYAGEASHRLLELNTLFTPFAGVTANSGSLKSGKPLKCGEFRITPFLVDHSAFDAYAFLVEAGGKRLFYSGDFRDHGRKSKTFHFICEALSRTRADALLLEGTMLGRPQGKTLTEEEIEKQLIGLLTAKHGPFFICMSAQNIDRLVSLYRAVLQTGFELVVDIYTAHVLGAVKDFADIPHPSASYDRLKVFYPYNLSRRLADQGRQELLYRYKNFKISREEIEKYAERTVMMVRPAMQVDLGKMDILPGATFIYSMWKGYQDEKAVGRLMAFAREKKMDVRYIHSSGHATPQALKKLIDASKPGAVIPIHTAHPEKFHDLGANIRLLEDGEKLHL